MKKIFTSAMLLVAASGTLMAQRKCGIAAERAAIIAQHPEMAAKFEAQRASLQSIADNYIREQQSGNANKTTTTSPIPVVFHIIVSPTQLTELGGAAGVAQRCDSQIAVLNRDYNRQNADSVLIPSGWKSRYGNAGIHFGLAHTNPAGHGTPGYEILTTSYLFTQGSYGDYADAKSSTYGLAAWDVTKYINVWCIYFSDASSLLGITTPHSSIIGYPEPVNNEGICITYNSLGKRAAPGDSYPAGGTFDRGRTLTHEMGHFFEIWHPWGDDMGACPWTSGGQDDGIADTPPESDNASGNPTYSIPGGTYTDACMDSLGVNVQPIGIPCLVFMDYTDDNAMFMFTKEQAAVMASMVSTSGESYSLTQHPTLLSYPVSVPEVTDVADVNLYPNPAHGQLSVQYNASVNELSSLSITNTIGQIIKKFDCKNNNGGLFSADLSGFSAGIYFVTCNFATGTVTRKIIVE